MGFHRFLCQIYVGDAGLDPSFFFTRSSEPQKLLAHAGESVSIAAVPRDAIGRGSRVGAIGAEKPAHANPLKTVRSRA